MLGLAASPICSLPREVWAAFGKAVKDRWARSHQERSLKLLGFLLLLAGWGIVLAAVALLAPSVSRPIFVLAGLGVEILGLALVMRSHPIPRGEAE